jgi:hypothetical protein
MPRSFSRPHPAGQGALPFAVCTSVLIRQPSHIELEAGGDFEFAGSVACKREQAQRPPQAVARLQWSDGAPLLEWRSGNGRHAPCDKAFR